MKNPAELFLPPLLLLLLLMPLACTGLDPYGNATQDQIDRRETQLTWCRDFCKPYTVSGFMTSGHCMCSLEKAPIVVPKSEPVPRCQP